jgi:hypothetical protein
MKTLSFVILLLAATPAFAQTQKERGEIADQTACYQQARVYLADLDKMNGATYKLEHAHYDPKSRICYAQIKWTLDITETVSQDPKEDQAFVEDIAVVDAFEGRQIAQYVDSYHFTKTGATWSAPSACNVNGEKCKERAVFNYLLWKLVPAFKPIDAELVK